MFSWTRDPSRDSLNVRWCCSITGRFCSLMDPTQKVLNQPSRQADAQLKLCRLLVSWRRAASPADRKRCYRRSPTSERSSFNPLWTSSSCVLQLLSGVEEQPGGGALASSRVGTGRGLSSLALVRTVFQRTWTVRMLGCLPESTFEQLLTDRCDAGCSAASSSARSSSPSPAANMLSCFPLKPKSSHPLHGITRDAGVSIATAAGSGCGATVRLGGCLRDTTPGRVQF